jgi:hypothetical protein
MSPGRKTGHQTGLSRGFVDFAENRQQIHTIQFADGQVKSPVLGYTANFSEFISEETFSHMVNFPMAILYNIGKTQNNALYCNMFVKTGYGNI